MWMASAAPCAAPDSVGLTATPVIDHPAQAATMYARSGTLNPLARHTVLFPSPRWTAYRTAVNPPSRTLMIAESRRLALPGRPRQGYGFRCNRRETLERRGREKVWRAV